MCDKAEFEVCRLCLNSRGLLMNVFGDNSKLQFLLEETIEDLVDVKVVEDANYPWLVCSNCMERLTEFRLFKRRCAECLSVFYDRIQKVCNPSTKDWITNRDEVHSEIKEEVDDDPIASDAVDSSAVDVSDDMTVLKEEIDPGSGSSIDPEIYTGPSMVTSMPEGDGHCSGNEEAGKLFPGEIKKEIDDDPMAINAIDSNVVDVEDGLIVVKEEKDTTSECFDTPEIDAGSLLVISMQEDDSHWSDNEDVNYSGGKDLHYSSDEEVDFKEECDANVPKEKDGLGGEVLQAHGNEQKQCGAGLDAAGCLLHACHICYEVFAQLDLLKLHMKHVHVEKGIQVRCDVCSEVFEHKNDLVKHIKLVHNLNNKHICQGSSGNFEKLSQLKTHMSSHTGEKSFKCETCPKAFSKNSDLKRHELTHTGKKHFECEVCSKTFSLKFNLTQHMVTHTGEKSHKCEICSKSFSLKGNLMRHMLTHTGEKPHKCHRCSKAFSLKSNLMQHMLTHTGEKRHQCDICQKAFFLKSNLRQHMGTHTGERRRKC